MSHVRGRRGHARNAASSRRPIDYDALMTALNPTRWVRGDSVSTSGGNLTAALNRMGADTFVATGATIVQPAADPIFDNKPSIVSPGGTARLLSSLGAASHRMYHDGTGVTVACMISLPNAGALNAIWGTMASGTGVGCIEYYNTAGAGTLNYQLRNAGGNIVGPTVGGMTPVPADTPTLVLYTYSESASPKCAVGINGALAGTVAPSGAPAPGDSAGTLSLMNDQDAIFAAAGMRMAEWISFAYVPTAPQLATIKDYFRNRYPSAVIA